MRKALILVAVFAFVLTAQAADHPQKPGRWRVTIRTEMPGLAAEMPPINWEHCVTAEDVKDPQRAVPRDPKDPCKVTDTKTDGKVVTWSINCPETKVSGHGRITYTEDSYSGELKMKVGEQEIIQKHSGKWMGACTK